MEIDERDVRYEVFSGSGPGGQYRNRHANCVRAIYDPLGIVATATSERSMTQNKAAALANLKAKILDVLDGRRAIRRRARHDAKPDASFGNAIRVYRLCGKDVGIIDRRTPGRRWPISVLTQGRIDELIRAVRSSEKRGDE